MEFGPFEVPVLPDDPETTLVLAGDINVGTMAYKFVEEMCERFYEVIYCPGNHEYYNQDMDHIREWWADHTIGNLTFLDDTATVLADNDDDVLIVGGTLWTDFMIDGKDSEWFSKFRAKQGMNDYHAIVQNGVLITPDDTVEYHNKTKEFIIEQLNAVNTEKKIVITHHLPHPICIDPKFKNSPLNAAFASDLTEIFEMDNAPDLWIHGHTHTPVDVMVNNTRILCNPGGYPTRERANNNHNPILTVEI
jgi:Icc-related predicted phosphoesterase